MRDLLIIDPSPEFLEEVTSIVRRTNLDLNVYAADPKAANLKALDSSNIVLIILPRLPNANGQWATLEQVLKANPSIPVLVVLDPLHESQAAEAMKRGASEIVVRTQSFETILTLTLRRAVKTAELRGKLDAQDSDLMRCHEAQRAKREFLSTITHELRTPLVGMRIYTQFLASGRLGPLAPLQKEKIEVIYRNTERLTHCIESIQRYQRLETPLVDLLPVDFDLRSVLGEAIATVMPVCMEKGITLGQSWPPEAVNVHADRELILEVIKDLLDNAVKFTAAKGSISVNAVEAPGRQALISIMDSGCGMSKEMQAHLFEPCKCNGESLHTSKGLGLGMRTVKRILDAHRSTIHVDSVVDVGTRVRFMLPPSQSVINLSHTSGSTRILRRRTVLIVDDDEDNLSCTRSVLEYAGYEVLGASSFEEAKTQLDEGHVDAVLLDVAMRDEDGLQTLHSIRRCAATSSLPVVMVSAKADDDVRVKASRMGASGFVVKPYVPAKLLRELDSVMEVVSA